MVNFFRHIGFWKSRIMYEWNLKKRKARRNFYGQFIKKGDLCFDVGAHLGDRSRTWLNLGAKVVAVEPQPTFFNYLKKKFSRSKYIHIENMALTAEEGTAEMHISNLHPTVSSLSDEGWRKNLIEASTSHVTYDETIEVKTNTLDYLIGQYGVPNFIKIDVEGFELEVLKGLNQSVNYISFEFLSFDLEGLNKCLDYLTKLGYCSYNWSHAETFKLDGEAWLDKTELVDRIKKFSKEPFSGDVYARFHDSKK